MAKMVRIHASVVVISTGGLSDTIIQPRDNNVDIRIKGRRRWVSHPDEPHLDEPHLDEPPDEPQYSTL